MNKNFSDEQLDQILRQCVKDSVLNEDEIDEIAGSPYLWRKVQQNIAEAKTTRRCWIPTWFDWRIAAFASAALVVCFGLIWFAAGRGGENLAQIEALEIPFSVTPTNEKMQINENPRIDDKKQIAETKVKSKTSPKKIIQSKSKERLTVSNKLSNRPVRQKPKTEETKTDFIALNYSPAAESGQIMKVKVPRSMMVSLGVTTKVENSDELVNAEVLVGDDGLARAIRFIQ